MANNIYNIARTARQIKIGEGTIEVLSSPLAVDNNISISDGKLTIPDILVEDYGFTILKEVYIIQTCQNIDSLYTGDLKLYLFDNDDTAAFTQGGGVMFDTNTKYQNLQCMEIMSGWETLPDDLTLNHQSQIIATPNKIITRGSVGNSLGLVLAAGTMGTLTSHQFYYRLLFETQIR